MKINVTTIISQINADFANTYRTASPFVNSGLVWNLCMSTVSNATLLNQIIHNNDTLDIPPVKSFLLQNQNQPISFLSSTEHCWLGCFWGFVFQYVFAYQGYSELDVNLFGIKTAARFENPSASVIVI